MPATATAQDALEAYRAAMETKQLEAVDNAYAEDAVVLTYSERNRPSSATEVRGRDAIRAQLEGMPEGLTHRIESDVVGQDALAFTLVCDYPTGEKVVACCICTVQDGKIAHQVGVETWDE